MYATTLKENEQLYSWRLSGSPIPVAVDDQNGVYTQQDLDNLVLKRDFKARRFDLNNETDLAAYVSTMERIVAGWYVQLVKRELPCKDSDMPVFWLEWVVQYYTRTA